MRAKGEGNITKRKDGRWMARYTIVMPNGKKRRQHIIKKNRDEVLALMKKEMTLANEGRPIIRDGRTVGQWLDFWLKHIAPHKVRQSTLIGYETTVRVHLKPAIGNVTLSSLSPLHVQKMISNHLERGGSVRVAQIIRNVLSAALRSAMQREMIHRNVARLVDLPQGHKKERPLWTEMQMREFLEKSRGHMYYPIFAMLCTYGMRRGEVLGLRWQDIDFEGGTFTISHQVVQMGSNILFGNPKTEAGRRTLPLLPHIRAILADLPHRTVADTDLVFTGRNGRFIQPSNLLRTFHLLTARYGLPRIPIHSIRHTVATMMKDNGVAPKDAQMTLGHADIQTTMQFYQHSSLGNKTAALEKIAGKII